MGQIVRVRNKIIANISVSNLVIALCVIDSIFIATVNQSRGFRFLFLLPLSYAISYVAFMPFIRKNCVYKRGFAYWIAQIVIAYRALLVPLACLYTAYSGGWTAHGTNGFGVEPPPDSIAHATLWMCSETVFAEAGILIGTIITRKMSKKRKWIEYESRERAFLKNKSVLVLFSLCAFALLIVFQRQLFSQFMILSTDYSQKDNAVGGSFFAVVFLAFRFSFLFLGYAFAAKKYKKRKKKFWILVAMLFLFVYIGYSVGVSRWMLILPAIASVEIYKDCFKPFPVSFAVMISIVAAIGVFSISFFKYGYLLKYSKIPLWDMLVLVFQQSNEYISGPRSVAQGLETLSKFGGKIKISTFFNSIFSGFAGLASLTNDADKLQSFFNYYTLGLMQDRPLICPILIEGLGFFPIFPWLFSVLFEAGTCILDFMSKKHFRYEYRFMYTYLGIWFALCFCLNTKIEMSQISSFLYCMLLMWVNTKIRFVSSRRR